MQLKDQVEKYHQKFCLNRHCCFVIKIIAVILIDWKIMCNECQITIGVIIISLPIIIIIAIIIIIIIINSASVPPCRHQSFCNIHIQSGLLPTQNLQPVEQCLSS